VEFLKQVASMTGDYSNVPGAEQIELHRDREPYPISIPPPILETHRSDAGIGDSFQDTFIRMILGVASGFSADQHRELKNNRY
jgi:hypothetical protein